MSKPPKPKYRTTNWYAYNESLRQRGALLLWIDKALSELAVEPPSPSRLVEAERG